MVLTAINIRILIRYR